MRKKQDLLISIIIPVYNVEDYLEKCLDSVINQTYKNLEIILIDDGSTDTSGKICDQYALQDKRIKVVHQKNGGVSVARNAGLSLVKGKYLTFIDSDDYVHPEYLEYLINLLTSYKATISSCGYKYIYPAKTKEYFVEEKIRVMDSMEALKRMLYQSGFNNSLWGKLYCIELFTGILFPKDKIHEDLDVMYKILLKAKKIVSGEMPYYNYVQSSGSLMRKEFSEHVFDVLDVVYHMSKDLQKYPELTNAVNSRVVNAEFFVLRQLPVKKYPEKYKQLKKNIKTKRITILKDPLVRKKTKLGIILSYFGFFWIKPFYKLVENSFLVKKID